MQLNYYKLGKGHPFIIIHGLYGSSDNWLSIAKELAKSFEVYVIDQRNHGSSPHRNTHTYIDLKEDLNDFMLQHRIAKAIILGHSMGGKTAMAFAQDYSDKISNMIIVDIAPKDYSQYQLSIPGNNHRHIISSMLSMDLKTYKTRTQIDTALSQHITDIRIRQFILKNLKRDTNKQFAWKLNIEVISTFLEQIMGNINSTKEVTNFPILFIKGQKSNYIGDDDSMLIRSLFPYAEITSIANAGHWVHAEQPESLIKTINYFVLDQ